MGDIPEHGFRQTTADLLYDPDLRRIARCTLHLLNRSKFFGGLLRNVLIVDQIDGVTAGNGNFLTTNGSQQSNPHEGGQENGAYRKSIQHGEGPGKWAERGKLTETG